MNLSVLMPAISSRERFPFCLLLAIMLHSFLLFYLGATHSISLSPEPLEVIWEGSLDLTISEREGEESYRSPASLPLSVQQDYVRRWIEHTERLGAPIAAGLKGEILVHVDVNATGMVQRIDIGPGPASLRDAVENIVRRVQPHPAFPENLQARQDQIRISRLWRFGDNTGNSLSSKQP